jgi:hypothetical protein
MKRIEMLLRRTAITATAAFALITGPVLHAQSDTARITGSVQDSTGAAVPGATIILTDTDTGTIRKLTSDGAGSFSANALPVGHYTALASLTGFQKDEQKLTLEVSQVQALTFKLAVGSESQTIEVTDAAPLIETTTSSTGVVIQGKELSDLPLNGRNFTQLALLAPGITKGAYGNIAGGTAGNAESLRYNDTGGYSLSANGLRPQANIFLLDGIDNNEGLTNGIAFFPPVEAMSEFRVTNTLAQAEFGRAGGAVTQAAIKSGTNSIHGSAFTFYRDSAIGSANPNYFTNQPIASFHRNQFGGTLGGPILKNKLFLFGDYQGLRQGIPQNPYISSTPTALMRTGNFSELLGSGLTTVPVVAVAGGSYSPTGCAAFTTVHNVVVTTQAQLNASVDNGAIFDPTTCKQFGTIAQPNIIPTARLNKAAINYLNAFPAANFASPNVLNNYSNIQIVANHYNDFDARLDYTLSARDLLFARYSYAQDDENKSTRYVGLPSGFGAGSNNTHPRGVAVGYDHTFSPNIVNEFRFGYTRPYFGYINPFEGTPLSANLGIANANRNSLLGGGALIGGNDSQIGYTGDGGPYQVPQKTYQEFDAISIAHGKHNLKFGANVIQRQVNFFQGDYRSKGFFNLAGGGGDYTGYEVSELLAGFVDNYSIANPTGYYQTRSVEDGFFAQDDWKVSKKLTLNLGLRYDLFTSPLELNNRQSNFDIASGTLKAAGVNGNSRSLINTNKNNFAPRLGFAYDVYGTGKTVIRGGYGIYYFLDRGGIGNVLSNNPEFNGASQYTSQNGYRITLSGQTPAKFDNTNTDATAALPSAVTTVNEANPMNVSVISYPQHNPTSEVQQYNLQLAQQFGPDTALDIAYVGTYSTNLHNVIDYSGKQLVTGAQFFSAQGLGVTENINNGSGNYNGLQVRLNRRLKAGIQFTAAYTFSHSLDNSTGPFSTQGGGGNFFITAAGPQIQYNYGNSDDDQRQSLNLSALTELPFGTGKHFLNHAGRIVNAIVGGFQIDPFIQLGTGTPFSLSYPSANGTNNRPDYAGPSPNIGKRKVGGAIQYFDATAFKQAPLNASGNYTRPGTVGRNAFYLPGTNTLAVSVIKAVPIIERLHGEFRGQVYNLFNTPQFAGLNDTNIADFNATTNRYATINSTRYSSQRQLEMAFRVTF